MAWVHESEGAREAAPEEEHQDGWPVPMACPNDCDGGVLYTADAPEGKPCPECDGEGSVMV